MRAASAATGLDDLGDAGALEALRVLVGSIEAEAHLAAEGRRAIGSMLVTLIEQRLRMVRFASTSDVVAYETVRAPLVVTGLPGTGTTLLAALLAQDPVNRALLGWQATTVVPPPRLADLAGDPRLRAALDHEDQVAATMGDAAPRPRSSAALPADCAHLLAPSFVGPAFGMILDVAGHATWCDGADMTEPYRFHHLGLRTLQTTVPTERWVLESPSHLWHLDALRAVYPDARVIVTHRDPAKVIPGVAGRSVVLRSMYSDRVDAEAVGRHWRDRCRHVLEVAAPRLADRDPAAVFHLPHAELVDDPVGSVERAYQHFGLDLCDLGRRRMMAWQDQHPSDHEDRKVPGADLLGLDEGDLRREFSSYMVDNHVPSET